jgi:hypothetical protein
MVGRAEPTFQSNMLAGDTNLPKLNLLIDKVGIDISISQVLSASLAARGEKSVMTGRIARSD